MLETFQNLDPIELSEKLLHSLEVGDMEAFQAILNSGADPNQIIDCDGTTILMEASDLGNFEIVKILVEAGANVRAKHGDTDTAIQYAANRGWVEIVNYLLPFTTKSDANIAKKILKIKTNGVNDLVCAAAVGDLETTRDLVNSGVPVNGIGIEGHNALYEASARGQSTIVQFLIDKGANLNIGGEGATDTPLMTAISHYNLSIISRLLKGGADPNQANYGNSLTPLMQSVLRDLDDPWIARKLISCGANINQENCFGSTAIMAVVFKSYSSDLKYFSYDEPSMVAFLDENGASRKGVDEMYLASSSCVGNQEIVSSMISKGVNLDSMTYEGLTALMYAVKNGHQEVVDMLISAGANINFAGGETALICGIVARNEKIVESLLSFGADSKVRNIYGDSPMHYVKSSKDRIYEMIKASLK